MYNHSKLYDVVSSDENKKPVSAADGAANTGVSVSGNWCRCIRDMNLGGICKFIAGHMYWYSELLGWIYGEYGFRFPILRDKGHALRMQVYSSLNGYKWEDFDVWFDDAPYDKLIRYMSTQFVGMECCVMDGKPYLLQVHSHGEYSNNDIVNLMSLDVTRQTEFRFVCNAQRLEKINRIRPWLLNVDAKLGDFVAVHEESASIPGCLETRGGGLFMGFKDTHIIFNNYVKNIDKKDDLSSSCNFFEEYEYDISGKRNVRICPVWEVIKDIYDNHCLLHETKSMVNKNEQDETGFRRVPDGELLVSKSVITPVSVVSSTTGGYLCMSKEGNQFFVSALHGEYPHIWLGNKSMVENKMYGWFECIESIVVDGIYKFISGRMYSVRYDIMVIYGEFGERLDISFDKNDNITIRDFKEYENCFRLPENDAVWKYITDGIVNGDLRIIVFGAILYGLCYEKHPEKHNGNRIVLYSLQTGCRMGVIELNDTYISRIRLMNLKIDVARGDVICVVGKNGPVGYGKMKRISSDVLEVEDYVMKQLSDDSLSKDNFKPVWKIKLQDRNMLPAQWIYPVRQSVKDKYLGVIKSINEKETTNMTSNKETETEIYCCYFDKGDWVADLKGNVFCVVLVSYDHLSGESASHILLKQQFGNSYVVHKNAGLHLWSINDIKDNSVVVLESHTEDKTYICLCNQYNAYYDKNKIHMQVVVEYMPSSETPAVHYIKTFDLENCEVRPATYQEYLYAVDKSILFKNEFSISDDVSVTLSEENEHRDKPANFKTVWNKSGRRVCAGDFLVRKIDGECMEIVDEYEDIFVVRHCKDSDVLSYVNKHTEYKKFYLWTPGVIHAGDLVRVEDCLVVVKDVVKTDDGIKLTSGLYIKGIGDKSIMCDDAENPMEFHPDKMKDARPATNAEMSMFIQRLSEL